MEVLRSLTALNVLRNLENRPGIADLQDKQPRYFAGTIPRVTSMRSVLPPWPIQHLAEDPSSQNASAGLTVTGQTLPLQVTGLHCQSFCTAGVSWEAMTSSCPLRPFIALTANSSCCAASRRYCSPPERTSVELYGNTSCGGMGQAKPPTCCNTFSCGGTVLRHYLQQRHTVFALAVSPARDRTSLDSCKILLLWRRWRDSCFQNAPSKQRRVQC